MQFTITCLGEAIKFKRCLLGWSQRKLAAQLEVDYTYISKLENNHTFPSIELLDRLENILKFEKGDLIQLCGFPSIEVMQLLGKAIKLKGESEVKAKLLQLLGE